MTSCAILVQGNANLMQRVINNNPMFDIYILSPYMLTIHYEQWKWWTSLLLFRVQILGVVTTQTQLYNEWLLLTE